MVKPVALIPMFSEKGKKMLAVDGYKFYQQHKGRKTGVFTMRCSNNDCRAKIYVTADDKLVSRKRNIFDHNHDRVRNLERQMIGNACKVAALSAPTRAPSGIVREELERRAVKRLDPRDVRLIVRNVHNARAARRGPRIRIPASRRAVHRAVAFATRTGAAAAAVFVNDAARGVIAFASEADAQRARGLHTLHLDGAFAYRAKHFGKMCVVHTYGNGAYQPLMFCCLRNGTRTAYVSLLRALHESGARPAEFVVDCDARMLAAVRRVYPRARMRCDRYAVLDAWCRKIRSLGMAARLNGSDRSEAAAWLRQVLGLPFLDADAAERCFVEHCMAQRPSDRPSVRFADYLTETFVDGGCEFPPSFWARGGAPHIVAGHAEQAAASREFRDELHEASYHRTPHVFRMLDTIVALREIAAAKLWRPVEPRAAERRMFVKGAVVDYHHGRITAAEFASMMGEQCNPHANRFPAIELGGEPPASEWTNPTDGYGSLGL